MWDGDSWNDVRKRLLSPNTRKHQITWRINYATKTQLARLLEGYKACLEREPTHPIFRVQVPLVELLLEGAYIDPDAMQPILERMQPSNMPLSITRVQEIVLETLQILLGRTMVTQIHNYEGRQNTPKNP